MVPMLAEEAKKRQGRRTDLQEATSVPPGPEVSGKATQLAADMFDIGRNTVERARQVKKADAELFELALAHPKAAGLSDGQIAAHCGVSAQMVKNHRPEATSNRLKLTKRTGRDGKTRDVSNIGRRKQRTEAAPAAERVTGH